MRGLTALRLASLSLLAIPLNAYAADLPVKAPPPPPVEVFNWTGFYVGGNVGGKWGQFDDPVSVAGVTAFGLTVAPGSAPFHLSESSLTAGGQIGYRWQTGSWVFGIEGDFNWMNLHGTETFTPALLGGGGTLIPGDSASARARWESSIRGSIGYAWDRWLVYATGGVAFADTRVSSNFIATTNGGITFPASAGSQSNTLTGGTVGAGVDYALNRNWDIGVEYRYTSYGSSNFNLGTVAAIGGGPGGTFAFVPATARVGLSTNEVLLKVNYRFDWTAPIIAKY